MCQNLDLRFLLFYCLFMLLFLPFIFLCFKFLLPFPLPFFLFFIALHLSPCFPPLFLISSQPNFFFGPKGFVVVVLLKFPRGVILVMHNVLFNYK
jgi:hypothetical protein